MTFPSAPGARPRPGGGFELWSWFFMRISGLVLLILAVVHLLWMHIYIGLENITFDTIAGRWTGSLGPLWRVYDLALLAFALTHGMNGARWVVDDYIHRRGWNVGIKSVLWVVYAFLIIAGAYVIFTFRISG